MVNKRTVSLHHYCLVGIMIDFSYNSYIISTICIYICIDEFWVYPKGVCGMRNWFTYCLRLLVLLVLTCNMGEVLFAATIYGGTSPGKQFENSSNWYYSYPVDFVNNIYEAKYDEDININGNVKLTGSLGLRNWGNLTLNSNSILIIDGDLHVSDKCDITLYHNSTLYITGNLYVENQTDLYSYVLFDMYNNSNVVIEGDVQTENGADIWIWPSDNSNDPNSDFYVFNDNQNTTSHIYKYSNGNGPNGKLSDGSALVDDYDEYVAHEATLAATIAEVSTGIDNLSCTTLTINSGTYRLSADASYCYLSIARGATLLIDNGVTLTLTRDNTIDNGTISNYGTIDCGNNSFTVIPRSIDNPRKTCRFTNNGYVKAYNFYLGTNESDATKANTTYFSFSCGSGIIAQNEIGFTILGWTGDMNLLGNYTANRMVIDYQSGGRAVNFGSDCGDSRVNLKNLTLKNNIAEVNINEITGLETLRLETYSSVQSRVDGSLIIGEISSSNNQSIGISGTNSSVISFCYNPTHGADFGGNDQSVTTQGTVIYRYDSNDNVHSWYTNGTENTPSTEGDIVCNNCTLKANDVNFSSCMVGNNNLLPIELVSFSYGKSSNEFVWTTASEKDNDYFVVEYSKNGKDWVECTEHVASMVNTGYAYNTEPIMPINESLFSYFRLKQVDLNGDYSYSNVITVSFFVENPCSEDNENSKIQIREFGNKWFRLINGELIYCENDNE